MKFYWKQWNWFTVHGEIQYATQYIQKHKIEQKPSEGQNL